MLTELQIAERKSWIGGSDAHKIVEGRWRELWMEKTNRAKPIDLSDNLPVQLGIFTEQFNLDWFEKKTGRKVENRGELARHPDFHYLAANLDGITTTSEGLVAYIDAKHVGKAGDQLTQRYTAQGTHCAIVLGLEWWCLSTIIGNSRWELTEQEVDPFFAAEYLEQCARFWGFVERDEEPPEPEPVALPPPRKLRIVQLEDEFKDTFPNWAGEAIALIRTFAETDAVAKKHAVTREALKDICPDDVGTITRGRFKLHKDRVGAVRMAMKKGENDGDDRDD